MAQHLVADAPDIRSPGPLVRIGKLGEPLLGSADHLVQCPRGTRAAVNEVPCPVDQVGVVQQHGVRIEDLGGRLVRSDRCVVPGSIDIESGGIDRTA